MFGAWFETYQQRQGMFLGVPSRSQHWVASAMHIWHCLRCKSWNGLTPVRSGFGVQRSERLGRKSTKKRLFGDAFIPRNFEHEAFCAIFVNIVTFAHLSKRPRAGRVSSHQQYPQREFPGCVHTFFLQDEGQDDNGKQPTAKGNENRPPEPASYDGAARRAGSDRGDRLPA